MAEIPVHLKYDRKMAICGQKDKKGEGVILTVDPSLVTCNECKFLMKEDK